jgi:pyroglutamyl-peptidase
MTVILTGFEPFPGVAINPSQKIVEHFQVRDGDWIAEVLPTAFAPAGERVRALIRQHRPGAVISIGVAARRTTIALERFALNINDADRPDNSGVQASGQTIRAGGPAAYRATLPLEVMAEALAARSIPFSYSNHAGAYVCNHVMYCALDEIALLGLTTASGFIHIPMMREADDQPSAEVGLPLAQMIEAVEACVQVVVARAAISSA